MVFIGSPFPFFALYRGKMPHKSSETLSMDKHGAAALSMIKSITLGHKLNTTVQHIELEINIVTIIALQNKH